MHSRRRTTLLPITTKNPVTGKWKLTGRKITVRGFLRSPDWQILTKFWLLKGNAFLGQEHTLAKGLRTHTSQLYCHRPKRQISYRCLVNLSIVGNRHQGLSMILKVLWLVLSPHMLSCSLGRDRRAKWLKVLVVGRFRKRRKMLKPLTLEAKSTVWAKKRPRKACVYVSFLSQTLSEKTSPRKKTS